MRALQLEYTSCRKGVSGSAGFQFRFIPQEVSLDERREIERSILFRPPRDLPHEPSLDELAGDFPSAFRSYRLASGRRCLTRSSYVGLDYSGRWGNFFAHTLLLLDSSAPILWPIDFYEWNGWRSRLPPEEDTDEGPGAADVVSLSSVPPAESFTFAELQTFLQEDPSRVAALERVIRAVILGHATSRAVVLRDKPINVLYWLACALKALPARHAWGLSVSTYEFDPRSCSDITGTTGETDFLFDERERNYQFFEFDFMGGQQSELSDATGDYAETVAAWMATEPNTLAAFFQFMRFFDHETLEPDLLWATRLFRLSREPPRELVEKDLSAMMAFADRWATPDARDGLVEIIGDGIISAGGLNRPDDYRNAIRFLAKEAARSGLRRHANLVENVFRSLLNALLAWDGSESDVGAEAWKLVKATCTKDSDTTARRLLEEPPWIGQEMRLDRVGRASLRVFFSITWDCLRQVGNPEPWNEESIKLLSRALVASASSPMDGIQGLFNSLPAEPRCLADTIAWAVRNLGSAGDLGRAHGLMIGQALGGVLASIPEEVAQQVRVRLDAAELFDVLLGEWHWLAAQASGLVDVRRSYAAYSKRVLPLVPAYAKNCAAAILMSALDRLSPADSVVAISSWLSEGCIAPLPPEDQRRLFEHANASLRIGEHEPLRTTVTDVIYEHVTRLKLTLRPNRTAICRVLAAWEQDPVAARLMSREFQQALRGVDSVEYRAIASKFLKAAFPAAISPKDHQDILAALVQRDLVHEFLADYSEIIAGYSRKKVAPELLSALDFYLNQQGSQRASGPESDVARLVKDSLRQNLEAFFSEVSERPWKEVRAKIEATKMHVDRSRSWRSFERAVEDKREQSGVFGRILGSVFSQSKGARNGK